MEKLLAGLPFPVGGDGIAREPQAGRQFECDTVLPSLLPGERFGNPVDMAP